MKFELSVEQQAQVDAWLRETVYPEVIAKQREEFKVHTPFMEYSWDAGFPYEGASGGGLTYEFTPTGLGTVVRVTYTKDYTLDISEYDLW